jgi:hypothetical protein
MVFIMAQVAEAEFITEAQQDFLDELLQVTHLMVEMVEAQ